MIHKIDVHIFQLAKQTIKQQMFVICPDLIRSCSTCCSSACSFFSEYYHGHGCFADAQGHVVVVNISYISQYVGVFEGTYVFIIFIISRLEMICPVDECFFQRASTPRGFRDDACMLWCRISLVSACLVLRSVS